MAWSDESGSGATSTTVTSGTMTIGSDADGTDRTLVFGHSTLKSVIGIDDDQDVFAINTDATFESTNNLEINASGRVTLSGLVDIGGALACGDTLTVDSDFEAKADVLFSGGEVVLGANSTTRGVLKLWDGGGINTPGYIAFYTPDGSVRYVFVNDNFELMIHSSIPSNTGGTVVGTQG